ncbi:hypothetical protein TanjilG_22443 [Lupinus angustifolius]|uniref:Uncharacterized protein n=1 Tax=Lupinus angustifolius TaxID=3871 RepID=A0A4P1RSR4_LUPAN|nr:PREDICTED: uncharacterized protein LOC109328625 [Lupinus angustifolius]OIW17331.1 hypothetical protein TanjilG_22443 [Lupinus angustifolius]
MMMCCHSRFILLLLLLLSSMLFLSFGYGSVRVKATSDHKYSGAENEEYDGEMGIMDYAEPEPNTNPRTGYLLSPPSPVPAPPPHS